MNRSSVESMWYQGAYPGLAKLLSPFSFLFMGVSKLRTFYLKTWGQKKWPVPILVVGNITVGGVGKTPVVIALAKALKARGLKVGIVSRGYKAQTKSFPYDVQVGDKAADVGDEPLLLAQKTGCPVVIAPKRNEAVAYLLAEYQSQIIISDDGLQHYRMGRDVELLVMDGLRGFGNEYCLPAGPLREPISRLEQVDFILTNEGSREKAYSVHLQTGTICKLGSGEPLTLETLGSKTIAAVAGIGNPERFYTSLRALGLQFNAYAYPDHYPFTMQDLNHQESVIIMTEKDAVKCTSFKSDKLYYLPVEAVLPETFWDALWIHPAFRRLPLL